MGLKGKGIPKGKDICAQVKKKGRKELQGQSVCYLERGQSVDRMVVCWMFRLEPQQPGDSDLTFPTWNYNPGVSGYGAQDIWVREHPWAISHPLWTQLLKSAPSHGQTQGLKHLPLSATAPHIPCQIFAFSPSWWPQVPVIQLPPSSQIFLFPTLHVSLFPHFTALPLPHSTCFALCLFSLPYSLCFGFFSLFPTCHPDLLSARWLSLHAHKNMDGRAEHVASAAISPMVQEGKRFPPGCNSFLPQGVPCH